MRRHLYVHHSDAAKAGLTSAQGVDKPGKRPLGQGEGKGGGPHKRPTSNDLTWEKVRETRGLKKQRRYTQA